MEQSDEVRVRGGVQVHFGDISLSSHDELDPYVTKVIIHKPSLDYLYEKFVSTGNSFGRALCSLKHQLYLTFKGVEGKKLNFRV